MQNMLRWYLIQTKPSNEAVAQTHLERQGYEIYLPRLLESIRRGGQWLERIAPLFPRYLFLRLSEGRQSLAPVRSSVGVANVVRFGSNYAIVPDGVIGTLRSRADPQSQLHRLNRRPVFAPGDVVRICGGAFDSLEGIFDRAAGSERVVVLLKLLGQDTPIQFPAGLVVPASG